MNACLTAFMEKQDLASILTAFGMFAQACIFIKNQPNIVWPKE